MRARCMRADLHGGRELTFTVACQGLRRSADKGREVYVRIFKIFEVSNYTITAHSAFRNARNFLVFVINQMHNLARRQTATPTPTQFQSTMNHDLRDSGTHPREQRSHADGRRRWSDAGECLKALALPKLWKVTYIHVVIDGDSDLDTRRKTILSPMTGVGRGVRQMR